MRWFVETTDGHLVQVRDVVRVSYDRDNAEVELIFESGSTVRCHLDEWTAAKGIYSFVPASPGIRVLYAAPYNQKILHGPTVIAWRYGGGEFPTGITVDCGVEHTTDPEHVAYLFPDGHVENCDGCFPTLDAFTERFNKQRARWEASRAK